ncbi:hypothetical protein [Vreelandella malpeensis]|uniref:Uncharacterized protein n=1 Tax=Vreelandella malpeensis TaxID=1172368 RepID=A0ABS8DWQ2_9GAMM|nr:hypothetical protein [Halomonas malpeensis]MCB8890490.1 hypothetical protein [Halomonas malpeensis]
MSERFPDIEVYLKTVDQHTLEAWLGQTLATSALAPAGKGKWKTRGRHLDHDVPILLVEKAADGFASLWFDSPHTPWEDDRACAQAVAKALGVEVRCSLGGWHPGDDPDAFWQVLADGREQAITWPDSGR